VPTDEKFTGQKLDSTGLYFYNARYYDPEIGRFISADPVGQTMFNPQSLNRYTYVLNNPLKYTDPNGDWIFAVLAVIRVAITVYNVVTTAHDVVTAVQNPTPANILTAVGNFVDPTPGNGVKRGLGLVEDAAQQAAHNADGAMKQVASKADGGAGKNIDDDLYRTPGSTRTVGESTLKQFGGETEVTFNTPFGDRRVDSVIDGWAVEVKTGKTSLNDRTKTEIQKDDYLDTHGEVKGVMWVFVESPVTGKSGPTKPLRDALNKAGRRGFEIIE
jgi:RHS repeat-associated protein